MKLVQSLLANKVTNKSNPLNDTSWGKTPEKRLFYWCTWIWSFMSGYENCKNIELVADDYGKSILIDTLELPYKSVKIELNGFDSTFWFLAKIKAYSLQQEPFLHYDGDVIFRGQFPHEATTYNLYGQHLSHFRGHYSQIYLLTKYNNMNNIPKELDNLNVESATREDFQYINSGIFGGKDLELIHYCANSTLAFYNNTYNQDILKRFFNSKSNLSVLDDFDSFTGGMIAQVGAFSYFEELLPVRAYKQKYGNLEGLSTFLKTSKQHETYINTDDELKKQSEELKYVHLMDLKRDFNPDVDDAKIIETAERVKQKIINYVKENYSEYYERITNKLEF